MVQYYGYMAYQKLKDKGNIDAKDLAKIVSQLSKRGDVFNSFFELIRKIRGLESKIPEEKLKKISDDGEAFIKQAEEIRRLKSPSKHIRSLTINEGEIHPSNISIKWDFRCERIKINCGECVYIKGNSGAGKTTLIKTLILGNPKSKEIMTADGEKVDRLYKEAIIYGKSETQLPSGLSVLERITSKQEPSESDREIVKEILKDVGYPDIDLDYKEDTSQGEKERLLIAKMMYRVIKDKKSIAVFDEPIGQVQEELKEELMKVIARMC